ncbi:MAG: SprT family zinc-dependent metalloprotease [Balneola sp.]|jgi:predicted metal-dependent hydrolase
MFRRKKAETVYELLVDGNRIQVTRKRIKTLRLKVNTTTKKIRVSCPYRVSEQELIDFVRSKRGWIEKHLSKKIPSPKKELLINYLEGERIPFRGEEYILHLRTDAKKTSVRIEGQGMVLISKSELTKEKKEKAINDFYRASLKTEIPKLIQKWEPVMGVSVAEFGVKKMKTRWGTCNIRDKRIWLSLELAKKSPELLEYVVVHEMVHLLERLHNQRFKNFMTQFLPNWKELQKQLNGRID